MKISGPYSPDYFLLSDEQSDCIFATRLAAHVQEAGGVLPEIWIDDAKRVVWYVFGSVQDA